MVSLEEEVDVASRRVTANGCEIGFLHAADETFVAPYAEVHTFLTGPIDSYDYRIQIPMFRHELVK